MPKKQRNFTLIEILIVLIIITVIVGLSLPAFSRLILGSAVDQSGQMIASQLAIARGEAIARRCPVALVLPGTSYTDGDSKICQSMRIAIAEQDGSSYNFSEWLPGSTWSFLPAGAIIAQVDSTAIGYELESHNDSDGEYVEPSGTCQVTDSPLTLQAHGSLSHNVRAVIFLPDGSSTSRKFITVMKGVIPPGASEATNTDAYNLFVLEVSPMTGKAKALFPTK